MRAHRDDRPAEHALDVSLREVSEGDADPGPLGGELRGVGIEPGLRSRVELALLPRRKASGHRGQAGGGLGDVDPVVEVAPERKRQLVEEQVLRGEGRIVRQAEEGRIVAVHVPVEAPHDVRKRLDVSHLGLLAIPLGKGVDRAQVVGIGDAAFAPGAERVFDRLHAGQVVDHEVRVAAELVAFVEVLRPVVGELDAGNAEHEGEGKEGDEPEEKVAAVDDEGAEAVEEVGPLRAAARGAHRQDREQGGQDGHGVDEGADHPERHEVAEHPERRGVRSIEAEEADHGRRGGEEHRPRVVAERPGHRVVPVEPSPHSGEHGGHDVHGVRDRDRHHDDRHP